jgi:SpoVK/Ycf46/Vps4 family AAA+-type ATPase
VQSMNAYNQATQVQQRIRPPWLEDVITFHSGRIARQFVLHFNITDYIIDLSAKQDAEGGYIRLGDVVTESDTPQTMREYLLQFLFEALSCQTIYTYSLANGLTASDAPPFLQDRDAMLPASQRKTGMQLLSELLHLAPSTNHQQRTASGGAGAEDALPTEIADVFKLLSSVLSQMETPVAVVLDYAEKLIPYHLGDGHGDREQLQVLEMVQRWALDPQIRQTNNIVVLLTTNIGLLPSSVYAEGSGCRAIRVPLPNENEREAFIRYKMSDRSRPLLVPLNPADFGLIEAERAGRLARATQGMRLIDIDNMSRRLAAEYEKRRHSVPTIPPPQLRAEDVQKVKAEVIQAQSADLLEIVPPVRDFREIGGLDNLKQYLGKRAKLMLSSQYSPLVPSGLLLAGPPGTGKTAIAEALATESGFNLVKMRGIQDKWVGSSERNLELVLNLLKDLHPVVVFVDEIDQAMVRRDTGQSGDSGVGARMFARLLEEMSNPANRGRILWVAATNRADIIDEALLRRFDRVVPLLTPDVYESCRIFATMVKTIVKQSGGSIRVTYGGDLAQSGSAGDDAHPNPTQEDLNKFLPVARITAEKGLTGAGIEIVVRRAIELVYEEMMDAASAGKTAPRMPVVERRHLLAAVADYKPNHNRATYDYQSLLAIRACNFHSVIPALPKTGVYGRIQLPDGSIDIEKLEAEIRLLEQQQMHL